MTAQVHFASYKTLYFNIVAADASGWSVGCVLERKSNQALGFKAILPDSGDGKREASWNVYESVITRVDDPHYHVQLCLVLTGDSVISQEPLLLS
jgi:hypothetical protein